MQDQRQQHWRHHRANVGTGVENPGCHGALTGGEPQARGLDAGRVVGGFGQPKDKATDHKADGRGGQAVGAGGQAPQQHRAEEHAFHADLVDQSALQHKANRVAHLEPEVDVGVVHRRPTHLFGEDRLHHAQGSAVDVIEGGGEEHQGQHAPASFTDGHGAADLVADAGVRGAGARSQGGVLRRHVVVPVF